MRLEDPLVAIFDDYDDTADMVGAALHRHHVTVIDGAAEGLKAPQVGAFVSARGPQAIIWNISPPYEANWNLLQMVREHPALAHVGVVVTTTHMPNPADGQTDVFIDVPIVGKPYDLDILVAAVLSVLPPRH